jgi:hypothetical protein
MRGIHYQSINWEIIMGQMKQLSIAIHDAVESGLMPNPFLPESVYALVEVTATAEKVIGVYAHKDLALWDAWLCEQDPEKLETHFFVRDMEFHRDTYEQATRDNRV